jgi:endo-1,4-beta-xylanase
MAKVASTMTRLTRRSTLLGLPVAAFAAARSLAAGARIPFGAAVMGADLRQDARLRTELVGRCDVIVPMNELKWDALRHDRARFDYVAADEILGFANQNGKSTRGHTLLWGNALPPWVSAMRTRAEAERELVGHIETVVGYYRGRIPSWDVVNEVIAHAPTPRQPMRDTLWQRLIGPEHVIMAFQAAHRADPSAALVLNDYDFENADERTAERRRQALRLVRTLQDAGIPVAAVGFQAHLYAEKPLDRRAITAFARELGRMGVGVVVTELDVIDWQINAGPPERDRIVAEVARGFLEALAEGQRPQAIVTWGLSDRSTWVSDTFPRRDGDAARPLPLDAEYREKPFWSVIQSVRGA